MNAAGRIVFYLVIALLTIMVVLRESLPVYGVELGGRRSDLVHTFLLCRLVATFTIMVAAGYLG